MTMLEKTDNDLPKANDENVSEEALYLIPKKKIKPQRRLVKQLLKW